MWLFRLSNAISSCPTSYYNILQLKILISVLKRGVFVPVHHCKKAQFFLFNLKTSYPQTTGHSKLPQSVWSGPDNLWPWLTLPAVNMFSALLTGDKIMVATRIRQNLQQYMEFAFQALIFSNFQLHIYFSLFSKSIKYWIYLQF